MFVDEDPTQGPVCVPDVEVVLVPTAGLAFAQHLHFKHNILSLIKIGMNVRISSIRKKEYQINISKFIKLSNDKIGACQCDNDLSLIWEVKETIYDHQIIKRL